MSLLTNRNTKFTRKYIQSRIQEKFMRVRSKTLCAKMFHTKFQEKPESVMLKVRDVSW